jgi:transcriptional regulator with XRE-family HTH domain
MSLIGKNIKKIRSVKKLNQSTFAELFDISRASIGSYEEGRAEPKTDKIIEIANYFSIDLNSILKKELTVNEISGFKLTDSKMLNATENNLISSDKVKKIIFVDTKSSSDLINHLTNKTQWTGRKIELPPSIPKTTELAFIHNDNAMSINDDGIEMGDVVFAETIEINNLFNNYTYLVVTEDFIYLRKVDINKEYVKLTSINSNFQPIIIKKERIVAFFKLNAVIKKTINHFINKN